MRRMHLLLLVSLTACDAVGQNSPTAVTRKSGWRVSSELDPMTDQTVHKATAILSGESIDAETSISCNRDKVTYSFRTFDKAGQPANMRVDRGRVAAMVRVDRQPALIATRFAEISNGIDISYIDEALPAGSKVIVRLPMLNGEETLQIDQTNSAVRQLLDQCVQLIGGRRQQARIASEREAAERYAHCGDHPCPIEPPPLEPDTILSERPLQPGGGEEAAVASSVRETCSGIWAYVGHKGNGDGLSVKVSSDAVRVQFLDYGSAYGRRINMPDGSLRFQDAQDGSTWSLSCTPSSAALRTADGRQVPLQRSTGDIFDVVKRRWGEDYAEGE